MAVIVLGLVALGAFLYRPATVLGVDDDALERLLGGESDYSKYVEIADTCWRCGLSRSSDSAAVVVHTRRFGCWTVVERRSGPGSNVPKSGCSSTPSGQVPRPGEEGGGVK